MNFKNVKTIIFDYDGTLHNSYHIYAPAFLKAYQFLVLQGKVEPKVWKSEEIKSFLGMNPKEMWESFEPKLDLNMQKEAGMIISKEMENQINNGKAILYDGALDVLKYLKSKGYYLIYLSNSKTYYMDAHKRHFKLDDYFDQMICSENYNYLSKSEILGIIKHELDEEIIIIGDRKHDFDAANHHDLKSIGCSYGYGTKEELKKASSQISEIKDLYHIL